MCISLKIHMMNSINWKKTQFTLSSTGASPRDFRYVVKSVSDYILITLGPCNKITFISGGNDAFLGFSQRLTSIGVYLLTVFMVGSLNIFQQHLSQ
jgi:hypothetical protein